MRNGFTLIELLAVIIILAIIALITTPVVLKVVDSAKESGRKSSVAGYADAVKLSINEKIFENKGSSPVIDATFLSNINYQGERVTCDEIKNTNNYGVILKTCEVEKSDNIYCFAKGNVYSCEDEEFINIYNSIDENKGSEEDTIYNSSKGVNAPQLTSGMTPIKWVDGIETVTTKDDSEWYDYNNKMWANAKTDDGSYWVWIPRYAYKITTGWHKATTGTIDVIFLKKDTIENSKNETIQTGGYSTTGTNTSNAYFLEPAFQNETENTRYGFWVAKFEASVSDTTDACYTSASDNNCNKTTLIPKFVANISSWRRIQIGNMYIVASNMANNTDYGWISETTDTHMMTNYEWGATAYLAQSAYGKNSEVWINNSNKNITGCAGSSASASGYSGCQNAYNTATGMNASTTGNITGVYDMSGGSSEYVAAYVDNNNSTLQQYGDSLINSSINKNIYKGSFTSRTKIYKANINSYGDAIYETSWQTYDNSECASINVEGKCNQSSWNNDWSYMPVSGEVIVRSGSPSNTIYAGIFNFHNSSGIAGDATFRVVSTIKY